MQGRVGYSPLRADVFQFLAPAVEDQIDGLSLFLGKESNRFLNLAHKGGAARFPMLMNEGGQGGGRFFQSVVELGNRTGTPSHLLHLAVVIDGGIQDNPLEVVISFLLIGKLLVPLENSDKGVL